MGDGILGKPAGAARGSARVFGSGRRWAVTARENIGVPPIDSGSHPRVALFCETFHEINGVALTARHLVDFASRHARPFFVVRPGAAVSLRADGSVHHLELPRSVASFGIERDLSYDAFLWRHTKYVRRALQAFRSDVIHVTSPGEFGQLGAWLAHTMRIPLVASWHTNLHQFAARRLGKLLSFLPAEWAERASMCAERAALLPMMRFYRIPLPA